ncbi:MAG: hypothetical protein ACQERF_06175 [Actinomycetota bacterium]
MAAISRLRNLIAPQHDKSNHDLMWVTLRRDIPTLMERLGLSQVSREDG